MSEPRAPKVSPLRLKVHAVGKRCLEAAEWGRTNELGALLVELHGCVELILTELENVDAEIEARVVLCLARLRNQGTL